MQTRAQSLRAAQTPSERCVCKILKAQPCDVWHFRRQVPFGTRYIAGFVSNRARPIVEIDGNTHDLGAPCQAALDLPAEAQAKRRADVVGIFPNKGSITQLIGAVLLEQNDECQLQCRYKQLAGMTALATPQIEEIAQLQIATKAARRLWPGTTPEITPC
jgi:hypothetical protein